MCGSQDNAGRVENSHVLIWNFLDPIHPQYVLEAPFDVFSFAFNPAKPEMVTGGMHNGQVRHPVPLDALPTAQRTVNGVRRRWQFQ